MLHEFIGGLPEWLVLGVAFGLLASVGAAGVFLVGVRLFPTRARPTGERLDGDRRRRGEIREYLDRIGETYAEDHPVKGHNVAFYLPARDVSITFDPRAFYRIDRSETHAVLVEYEMPGANLGYRLPFETPEIGPENDAGPEPELAPFDSEAAAFRTLGLPASATREEVREAYREKVKEVHPDHGGDGDEFKRVREAYTAAKQQADG